MTSQRIGKYACLEIKSRYLLRQIPDDLRDNPQGWFIIDRYLSESQSVYETIITNMYLTETEYSLFETLEAKTLKKKRYPYSLPNLSLSIDVFGGHLQGLILAEMEMEKMVDLDELALPSFILKDVTDDLFFSGGNLATMTDEEFRQGLLQRLREYKDLS